MKRRVKRKNTNLFFDSFKHFKNNFCNLACIELPMLVDMENVIEYLKLKPVNYKSKYPDMKKIGIIDYDKPSDGKFDLTEEGKIIYDILNTKIDKSIYDMTKKRIDSIKPTELWEYLTDIEKQSITKQFVKLLISYYDTADCLRPYLCLIKLIEHYNISKLDHDVMCNILAQEKSDILFMNIKEDAYESLEKETKIELNRPLSYIYNGLETAGIINDEHEVIYDREFVKDIIVNLNELYFEAENSWEIKKGRSAEEQRKFRDKVLEAYGYTCAISGESISIRGISSTTYLLEAAHIIPYSDSGSFSINNGIALSPQLHKMFDKKLFALQYTEEGNLEVIVTTSDLVFDKTGVLEKLNHKVVTLPKNPEEWPDEDAINYRKRKYLL